MLASAPSGPRPSLPLFVTAVRRPRCLRHPLRYVSPLADGRVLVANFTVPRPFFNPGAHPFHGLETAGTLFVIGPTSATFVGIIGDGTITLNAAAPTDAAPITGELSGNLVQFGCAAL